MRSAHAEWAADQASCGNGTSNTDVNWLDDLFARWVHFDAASGWLEVKLSWCRLEDNHMTVLAKHLERLLPEPRRINGSSPLAWSSMDLNNNFISDIGMTAILDVCEQRRVYFQRIAFYKNRLGDITGERLGNIVRNQASPIRELLLSHNKFTDHSLFSICAAIGVNQAYTPRCRNEWDVEVCKLRFDHNAMQKPYEVMDLLSEEFKPCGCPLWHPFVPREGYSNRQVAKVLIAGLEVQAGVMTPGLVFDAAALRNRLRDDGIGLTRTRASNPDPTLKASASQVRVVTNSDIKDAMDVGAGSGNQQRCEHTSMNKERKMLKPDGKLKTLKLTWRPRNQDSGDAEVKQDDVEEVCCPIINNELLDDTRRIYSKTAMLHIRIRTGNCQKHDLNIPADYEPERPAEAGLTTEKRPVEDEGSSSCGDEDENPVFLGRRYRRGQGQKICNSNTRTTKLPWEEEPRLSTKPSSSGNDCCPVQPLPWETKPAPYPPCALRSSTNSAAAIFTNTIGDWESDGWWANPFSQFASDCYSFRPSSWGSSWSLDLNSVPVMSQPQNTSYSSSSSFDSWRTQYNEKAKAYESGATGVTINKGKNGTTVIDIETDEVTAEMKKANLEKIGAIVRNVSPDSDANGSSTTCSSKMDAAGKVIPDSDKTNVQQNSLQTLPEEKDHAKCLLREFTMLKAQLSEEEQQAEHHFKEAKKLKKQFEAAIGSLPEEPQALWSVIRRANDVGWENVEWKNNFTGLHLAAHLGREDAMPLLIAMGADPAAKDWKGRTAQDVLRKAGQSFCEQDTKKQQSVLLELTSMKKHLAEQETRAKAHLEEVENLKKQFQATMQRVPEEPKALWSAVRLASEVGWSNVQWKNNFTGLHLAAHLGRDDVMPLLIAMRADPVACDWKGRTALEVARKGGHVACVEALEKLQKTLVKIETTAL